MPRIWADTIDTHRRQVTDAILDATAELIAEQGPLSVAMSAIAKRAGIGRATLYKYFPDVESIVIAWHTRDFAEHLERLKALSERDTVTLDDVADFVGAQRHHHAQHQGDELVGALAQTIAGLDRAVEDVVYDQVVALMTDLVTKLIERKEVRADLDADVLARWLFHTIHAPPDLDDRAVSQLVVASLAPTAAPPRPTRRQPGRRSH
ncbi:MAG: TetR/AcrR family transcriptional regulator [Acidimicrobiia bacterium]